MYFYVAIRFLADVVPALVLLSVLGMWQGYCDVRARRAVRVAYSVATVGLASASIPVSIFLTMAESYQQFHSHNPQFMQLIPLLFRH